VTLVEARRKRVSFLLAAQRELDLGDVAVKEGRADVLLEQEPDLAGAFDVVVARSVGPPEALLPLASKYLKAGGLFVVSGPPNPRPQEPFKIVRVAVPGTRKSRVFLRAMKES
jgi:16S rRNA G527 N7-methylase RsmG